MREPQPGPVPERHTWISGATVLPLLTTLQRGGTVVNMTYIVREIVPISPIVVACNTVAEWYT